MTIKEAAEKTGVSVDNLRFYEKIGLIPAVPRTSSGIRNFDEATLSWVEFVLRFKRSGMPLEMIRRYVELALQGDSTKQERKELLLAAKEDLLKKQEQIQESLDVINYKLDTYEQKCGPITAEMVAAWKAKQPSE